VLRKYYAEEPRLRKFKSKVNPPLHPRNVVLWFSLFAWIAVTVACLCGLFFSPFMRWYACIITAFYVTQGLALGGVEKMEMLLYDQFRKPAAVWGVANDDIYAGGDSRKSAQKCSSVYDKYLN